MPSSGDVPFLHLPVLLWLLCATCVAVAADLADSRRLSSIFPIRGRTNLVPPTISQRVVGTWLGYGEWRSGAAALRLVTAWTTAYHLRRSPGTVRGWWRAGSGQGWQRSGSRGAGLRRGEPGHFRKIR